MIDIIKGIIYEAQEKSVSILVNGFGFKIATPRGNEWSVDQQGTLYTYLHWHAEQGPSLFGFSTAFERTVFLLIIECPKIGPSIALNILHQLTPSQFLEIVTSQNEKGLSNVNGIGAKKAEQIIVELKHKVAKLTSSGLLVAPQDAQESFMYWQQVNEILLSLNYSKQEIQKVIQLLSKKYADQPIALDQLIRSALSLLSSINTSSIERS
ncbi:Holliday junction branch migration protein RuvA [Candidatus Dependentiae bacterium]|nr:Holliday junction branch migration protein RuvA [Candidatus Dependentiae bacterium]